MTQRPRQIIIAIGSVSDRLVIGNDNFFWYLYLIGKFEKSSSGQVYFKCPFLYVRVPQIEALPISVAKQPFRDLKTHKLTTMDSYRQGNVMTVLCAQMVCAVLFVGTTLLQDSFIQTNRKSELELYKPVAHIKLSCYSSVCMNPWRPLPRMF